MKALYYISSLVLLLMFSCNLDGQDCCIEQEINGITCEDCTAPGWDPINSPDLSNNNSWGTSGACLMTLSPSIDGGGFAVFANTEGITTEISGLTPGNTYAYGFEYANPEISCFTSNAELTLELDGTIITYPQEPDWTTVIECFTASDTDITITFTSAPLPGSSLGVSAVDGLSCTFVEANSTCASCCDLELSYDETPELCPGVSFEIVPEIINGSGSYQVEWTSIPADGVDYLDDDSSLNPTFTYPIQDNNPEIEYLFTAMVTDGSCTGEVDVPIKVLLSDKPDFENIELCITSTTDDLPQISEDGYSGSWLYEEFTEDGDDFVDLRFLIDNGQNNCLEAVEYEFYIDPGVAASFNIETSYCASDPEDYVLPEESEEFYFGEWNPDEFTPEDLSPGEYTFFYTGSDPADCIQPYELIITIEEPETVSFALPDTICSNNLPFSFPTESLNNINGTWDIDTIHLVFARDTLITNVFTPEQGTCAELYIERLFIDVIEAPIFSELDTFICGTDLPYTFPTITTNGITGNWLVPVLMNNYTGDTTIVNSFALTSGSCYDTVDYQFNFIADSQLTFNLPSTLCSSELPYTFPSSSVEGIIGNWSTTTISNVGQDSTVVNVFTSNATRCSAPYTHELTIPSSITPSFDLPVSICANEESYTPTSTSLEGIEGNWTPSTFDPNNIIADSILLTWNPLASASCVAPITHIIYKEDEINYGFIIDSTFCQGEDLLFPMESSTGMVNGTWSIENINSLTNAGMYINTFTPADSFCAEPMDLTIKISDISTPTFDLPAYLCADELNYLLPLISDNNITGTWNIDNIDIVANPNTLMPLVFSPDIACADPITLEIYALGPFDIDFLVTEPSLCGAADATINLIGDLTDLEFSIDDGTNWATTSSYPNLSSGNYEVFVRNQNYPECISEFSINIDGPGAISLGASIVKHDTDCLMDVGSITIQQLSPEPLQFSIDGGLSWQDSPVFSMLAEGDYTIEARPIGGPSCAQFSETIDGPLPPSIIELELTNINSCLEDNGSIVIDATSSNLIYSINDGQDFSSDNQFTNLEAGTYDLVIRSEDYQNCDLDTTAILIAPETPSFSIDFYTDPTACTGNNGSIILSPNSTNVEYTIDGIMWQSEPLFEGLSEGNYTVTIREIDFQDCQSELDLTLATEEEELEDITFQAINPIGCNADNGSILFNTTNNLILQYTLIETNQLQSNSNFENLTAGIYNFEITSEADDKCKVNYQIELVEEDCECAVYDLSYINTDISCDGTEFGSIVINPYLDESILWENTSTDFEQLELSAGNYAFTITYQDQECLYTDTITIAQPDPIDFLLDVSPSACTASENGSIEIVNVSGGSNEYRYSIDNENFQDEPGFYNLSADSYTIYVKDAEDCLTMKDAIVEIVTDIDIVLPNSITVIANETVTLNPLIEASSIDSFTWSPTTGILDPNQLVVEISPEYSSSYTLTIFYDACTETRNIDIIVEEELSSLYIPNTISLTDPNNSTLYVQSTEGYDREVGLSVYDRWGNLVYKNANMLINDANSGWNPRTSPGRIQGVYLYVVNYMEGDQQLIKSGTITLLN